MMIMRNIIQLGKKGRNVMKIVLYMTQIRDDSKFTSNGVIRKLKYIYQHFVAFEARDLILKFSKNSAIMIFLKI